MVKCGLMEVLARMSKGEWLFTRAIMAVMVVGVLWGAYAFLGDALPKMGKLGDLLMVGVTIAIVVMVYENRRVR